MLEKQMENKRHNTLAKLFGIHMTENIWKTYMPNIRAYFLISLFPDCRNH